MLSLFKKRSVFIVFTFFNISFFLIFFASVFYEVFDNYKSIILFISTYFVFLLFIFLVQYRGILSLNSFFKIFIILLLFIFSYFEIYNRSHLGMIVLLFDLFLLGNPFLLFLNTVVLFVNESKFPLAAGLIILTFVIYQRINSKYLKNLFLIFGIVFSLFIFYIKVAHWIPFIVAGDYERIHTIYYRMGNYIQYYELLLEDPLRIMLPFNPIIISDKAMDSGFLIAFFRSGTFLALVLLFVVFRFFYINYGFLVSFAIFLTFVTQASILHPVPFSFFILLYILFGVSLVKKNNC